MNRRDVQNKLRGLVFFDDDGIIVAAPEADTRKKLQQASKFLARARKDEKLLGPDHEDTIESFEQAEQALESVIAVPVPNLVRSLPYGPDARLGLKGTTYEDLHDDIRTALGVIRRDRLKKF